MRVLSQRSLEAFRLTMISGSVSRAADSLRLSQPAVSRLVKALEIEVGFPLFERLKGRMIPTYEASLLFEEVQRAYIRLEKLTTIAAEIRSGRRGRLVVASLSAFASFVIPEAIVEFSRLHEDTSISLFDLPSDTIVNLVLARECDIGFVNTAISPLGVTMEKVYRVSCRCILPPGHRLATRSTLSLEDLSGETLVTLSTGTLLGQRLDTILRDSTTIYRRSVEANLSSLVSAAVLEGAGIGIVDAMTAARHVDLGGASIPFGRPLNLDVALIRPTELTFSSLECEFIGICDRLIEPFLDTG